MPEVKLFKLLQLTILLRLRFMKERLSEKLMTIRNDYAN